MLTAHHWERSLLDMAHDALDSASEEAHFAHAHAADRAVLDAAYRRSEEITRDNSKTFFLASSLMPAEKRRATRALYAFCRITDDLVDRAPRPRRQALLAAWRQQVSGGHLPPAELADAPQAAEVSLAWADARLAYGIPRGYVDQLIDGLAMDLTTTRYERFSDLAHYCYGAASTVGLMSMHITGYSGREAVPGAVRLGVALQLTNILRDVGEDWQAGRLYLPREELHAFGICEEQIADGRVDHRWRAFMRYQINRARHLYADALPSVSMLHPDGRFAIAAAGELYRGILDRIEAADYNVFTRRAALSGWGKVKRLPGIWLRAMG
jgi:phytoene synthase